MNNFSPNMLKTFEICQRKYHFKYIEKITMPQKSSLFEKGKKIHALANYYLRGDNISKMESSLNQEESNTWEMLKNNIFLKKEYLQSEYNLSCKIGDYWIGGRLDALVKDDEYFYILDYKTGSIPQNPEYDFQTMIYLLCASKMYGENIKFVYIDLKNNQNFIIDYSLEKEKIYENKILDICNKINNFELTENINHTNICKLCEYKKICI